MKLMIKPIQRAFTLIELMIVIAIIAILATVALPSYNNYTKKAALSELLSASSAYKTDVEICIYNTGETKSCSSGINGIKSHDDIKNAKYLAAISVVSGVINVTGKGSVEGYGYTLTPDYSSKTLSWKTTCIGEDKSLFPAAFCSE